MHISFVGAGYVGLVSAVLFSHLGYKVISIDSDEKKITNLKNAIIPIYEPGLEKYLKTAIDENTIEFHNNHIKQNVDIVFIAVGTPSLDSGEADLSYVYNATLEAAMSCSKDTLIVIKSTVPPGSCNKLKAFLKSHGYENEVASNPEFLREGSAIEDFLNPDRIIIGTSSTKASDLLEEIYRPLTNNGIDLIKTDTNTAELIKYASNSFLATKIGFINEMANLCEVLDADIDLLSKGMGSDKRIGSDFLKAGPGFGGSCFPKDILALSYIASDKNQKCEILDAVISSNKNRKEYIVNRVINVLGSIEKKKIAILGITFKAFTDDVRHSPAVEIAKSLQDKGANIYIYDPEGMKNASNILEASFCSSPYHAAENASAILILTEWDEFKKMDYALLANILEEKIIFDFRNILDEKEVKKHGLRYYKIGQRSYF